MSSRITMLDLKSMKSVARQSETIESLISNLDERGVLVFQVLLGQQAIALLNKKKPTVLDVK